MVTGIALFWIACGIAGYGLSGNYFQKKYSLLASQYAAADRMYARFPIGVSGPVGLFAILLLISVQRGPWGWRL
jgi:hypothetical protein